jgi:protein-tyrosine phosphatase
VTDAAARPPVRVLMVCWGNICRSPTAEGVLRHIIQERGLTEVLEVDSAGTSGEHAGEPPDRRAREEAARRGLDLSTLRARRVEPDDFESFDLLLAADRVNEDRLRRAAPSGTEHKVRRLTEFGPDADGWPEVPDPYYGGADGFTEVFDLVERACSGLLEHLERAGHV